MKILVFDDTEANRTSATISLAGHELTIVGTYDDAQDALAPTENCEAGKRTLRRLLVEAGFPGDFYPGRGTSKEDSHRYYNLLYTVLPKELEKQANFDVVMTDLMVPASKRQQGPRGERFVGQEMPLGTTIALLALSVGVKNVAVVTDMNHHDHPAAAMFDCFKRSSTENNGVRVICTNRVGHIEVGVDGEQKIWGKNWGQILQDFIPKVTSAT